MATLTSQQLKDSYQSLVTIGDSITSDPTSGVLENGLGNPITSLTLSGTEILIDSSDQAFLSLDRGTSSFYAINRFFTAGTEEWRLGTINDASNNFYLTGGASADTKMITVTSGGDISFRDTSTNEAFYWDASEAFLGIGTVPATPLHVNATNANACIINVTGTSPNYIFDVRDDNVSQFRVDSSGNTSIYSGVLNLGSDSVASSLNCIGDVFNIGVDSDGNSGGSPNMRFNVSGSEKMRIDSSGNVGLGVTPSAWFSSERVMQVGLGSAFGGRTNNASETNVYANTLVNSGGSAVYIANGLATRYSQDGGKHLWYTAPSGTAGNAISFTQAMTLDTSANVGIGETDPDSKLHLKSASAELLELERTSVGAYRLAISASDAFSIYDVAEDSDRLTIDTSGNVLVGKTTNTYGSVGSAFGATGASNFTRDADPPVGMNRLTSDGKILSFAKDSSEVGSIGTGFSSTALYIGGGDVGLCMYAGGDNIFPTNGGSTTIRDAEIDLGANTARWKDLYLSGSVYLGGTTSANALDDYEEGTHDTAITCGTSGTITLGGSTEKLQYTKIGRLVTVTGRVAVSGVSSPTGNFTMSLPFTIADLDEDSGRSTGSIKIFNTSTNVDNFFFTALEGNAFITVFKGGSTNGTSDSADTFSGNETIALSITYVAA